MIMTAQGTLVIRISDEGLIMAPVIPRAYSEKFLAILKRKLADEDNPLPPELIELYRRTVAKIEAELAQ